MSLLRAFEEKDSTGVQYIFAEVPHQLRSAFRSTPFKALTAAPIISADVA